jgi:hypothetical protein
MIHAVDSLELLQTIEIEGKKINRKIPCLIQIHIAQEETKFGLNPGDVKTFFESAEVQNLAFADIQGLMGMATFTDNLTQIGEEFETLAKLFEAIKYTDIFIQFDNKLSNFKDIINKNVSIIVNKYFYNKISGFDWINSNYGSMLSPENPKIINNNIEEIKKALISYYTLKIKINIKIIGDQFLFCVAYVVTPFA